MPFCGGVSPSCSIFSCIYYIQALIELQLETCKQLYNWQDWFSVWTCLAGWIGTVLTSSTQILSSTMTKRGRMPTHTLETPASFARFARKGFWQMASWCHSVGFQQSWWIPWSMKIQSTLTCDSIVNRVPIKLELTNDFFQTNKHTKLLFSAIELQRKQLDQFATLLKSICLCLLHAVLSFHLEGEVSKKLAFCPAPCIVTVLNF